MYTKMHVVPLVTVNHKSKMILNMLTKTKLSQFLLCALWRSLMLPNHFPYWPRARASGTFLSKYAHALFQTGERPASWLSRSSTPTLSCLLGLLYQLKIMRVLLCLLFFCCALWVAAGSCVLWMCHMFLLLLPLRRRSLTSWAEPSDGPCKCWCIFNDALASWFLIFDFWGAALLWPGSMCPCSRLSLAAGTLSSAHFTSWFSWTIPCTCERNWSLAFTFFSCAQHILCTVAFSHNCYCNEYILHVLLSGCVKETLLVIITVKLENSFNSSQIFLRFFINTSLY